MRHRWLLPLLAVPPLLLAWGSARLADRLGSAAGAALARAAELGGPSGTGTPPSWVQVVPRPRVNLAHSPAATRESAAESGPSLAPRRWGAGSSPPTRGLRVRGATVLRLANSGHRPHGRFVPARGARPAGILLSGVTGLGIGIEDGDILTHAGGIVPKSPADVMAIVIAVRGQGVPEISGRVWHQGEVLNLVVEQPYPVSSRMALSPAARTAPPSLPARSSHPRARVSRGVGQPTQKGRAHGSEP